jgi:hypothetical protein
MNYLDHYIFIVFFVQNDTTIVKIDEMEIYSIRIIKITIKNIVNGGFPSICFTK